MEYNASATKYLFWFVEAKETARLLDQYTMDEVKGIVVEQNLYQQKQMLRLINEFGCIRSRLEALPDSLVKTQSAIENALKNAEYSISTTESAVDRAVATKKRDKYVKQLAEIKTYYQALSHVAQQRIDLLAKI